MSEAIKLTELIAPTFYRVHKAIKHNMFTHYWLTGGRGSTKSSFVSLELVLDLIEHPQHNAVALRRVANTLRDSVVPTIQWAISSLGLSHMFSFNNSTMTFTYRPTGQMILCKGTDKEEKLKGLKFKQGYAAFLWFEEADQFKGELEVRNIRQSLIRGGERFTCVYTMNPPASRDNWANKHIMKPRNNMYVHRSTYLDVPRHWLGEEFFNEADDLKAFDELAYKNAYLGEVTGTGGSVFTNVVLRQITQEEIDSLDCTYSGVDFGWFPDPWCYIRSAYHAPTKRLFILAEESGQKVNTDEQVKRILKHLRYEKNNRQYISDERIICDSATPQQIDAYRALGLRAEGAKKGAGYRDASYKWLASRKEIVIDPSTCPMAAQEFIAKEYERNKAGEWISGYPDGDDHAIDAVRYQMQPLISKRGGFL